MKHRILFASQRSLIKSKKFLTKIFLVMKDILKMRRTPHSINHNLLEVVNQFSQIHLQNPQKNMPLLLLGLMMIELKRTKLHKTRTLGKKYPNVKDNLIS
jgi:hypothetical protein